MIAHAQPGQVVKVGPLGAALPGTKTATLVKGEQLEIVRLIVPAGKEIATHRAKGEIVVQCLEGRIGFTALGQTHTLEAGHLLYLPKGEPHSVRGIQDGSLLLTMLLPSD